MAKDGANNELRRIIRRSNTFKNLAARIGRLDIGQKVAHIAHMHELMHELVHASLACRCLKSFRACVWVCGCVLWVCACVCAQEPHRYMNTCMSMCMHVQNAKPEEFNLPLAIFLSLIGLPFVVLRNLYKLARPMLPVDWVHEQTRPCVEALFPPPMIEETVSVRTVAGEATGISLEQVPRLFGSGPGKLRVAHVERTSVFVNLLQVGDSIVSINGVDMEGKGADAAAVLRDCDDLRISIHRVDRAGAD